MSEDCKIKRWDQLKTQLHNVKAKEAIELLAAHPGMMVIDCRQPKEYSMVRLPKAVNVDYLEASFWEYVRKLPKDEPYLVYCNTCRRSTRVCTLMKNGGFEKVYNLDGGLKAWIDDCGDGALVRGDLI
ncbi:rhodanese-like domain-containing protein [Lewinella cohaerens]|uniref:rhodanese-like domain-containing protein n=1 Tax=Lewinella cohaerens TaxID=70995 RepID=UPI0003A71144|nr:rhodanese-like domain-containing protein [Lewinella cohaerens]